MTDIHTLTFTLSSSDLDDAVYIVFKRLIKRAVVPGFRKGKGPRHLFEQHFGKMLLLQTALEDVIPPLYWNTLEALQIDAIDVPTFSVDLEHHGFNKPLTVTASVPVKPPVTLGRLAHGIPLTVEPVTDEQVDEAVSQLAGKLATLEEVDGPSDQGMYVKADLLTYNEDGTVLENESVFDYVVEVLAGTLHPELDAILFDVCAGSITTANLYSLHGHGGRANKFYHARVKAVYRKVLPNADQLAQHYRFAALADLQADLRARLQKASEQQAKVDLMNRVVKATVDSATVDVPPELVERRVQQALADLEHELAQAHLSLGQYCKARGIGEHVFANELRPLAKQAVRTALVMEEVAKAAGIEASKEEAEAEFDKAITAEPRARDLLTRRKEDREHVDRVRADLMTRKAAEWLVEQNGG